MADKTFSRILPSILLCFTLQLLGMDGTAHTIENGTEEQVLELLNHGYNFRNTINFAHQAVTIMGVAAARGHVNVVQWLHEHGIPLDAIANRTTKFTPLQLAALGGRTNVLEYLQAHGIDIVRAHTSSGPFKGYNALHLAALKNNHQLLEWLCSRDAEHDALLDIPVNRKIRHGFKPLHIAALHGRLHVLEWLQNRPVDLNEEIQTGLFRGCQPIHLACMLDRPNTVNWLADNGADIHATVPVHAYNYFQGCSCVHIAAMCHNPGTIERLEAQGADIALSIALGRWRNYNVHTISFTHCAMPTIEWLETHHPELLHDNPSILDFLKMLSRAIKLAEAVFADPI